MEVEFPRKVIGVTLGGVTLERNFFVVAHGDPKTKASIMGSKKTPDVWEIPFGKMFDILQNAAERTGRPVVYCSCYSNTENLPEKITLGGATLNDVIPKDKRFVIMVN